jgi:Type I phosphodiesterase / nucleotide pyrophosphatase
MMVHRSMIWRVGLLIAAGVALAACSPSKTVAPRNPYAAAVADMAAASNGHVIKHVLLISVDGMHNGDLAHFVAAHPTSVLAKWTHSGVTYRNVTGSKPSDSFPGLMALITGASAATTGVYYDVSYDRQLSPPGSACKTIGTTVVFDESIDKDMTRLDGGGGINVDALPLDPNNGCKPVFPWQYLRVNTIFEVAHNAGLRTAWSDKHIGAYTIVNGPSGKGVTELANLEVAATLPDGHSPNDDVADNNYYDSLKVEFVLNWCRGLDHMGAHHVGVPAIFGMDYQTVSTGEKKNGYLHPDFTPSPELENALEFVDRSLGKMEKALGATGVADETLIIVAAKHGQTPVAHFLRRIVADTLIPTQIDSVAPNLVAQATEDNIGLIWLNNQDLTAAAADKILLNSATNHAKVVLWGSSLTAGNAGFPGFPSPLQDSRTPDIMVLPEKGVIYAGPSATKLAEHGGFNDDDVDTPVLLFLPGLPETHIDTPVRNRQVAPTVLLTLGLNPGSLAGAVAENTQVLPGWTAALSHRSSSQIVAVKP